MRHCGACLREANWFGLPGGMLLDRTGENNLALFLVVTGCLGVFVNDERGQRRLVAHVPAGETVGEMSLISGDAHSAQLVALRDTELLRVSPEAFNALISRHPRVMLNLMRLLVRRLHETTKRPTDGARPKTFAVVPLQEGLHDEPIAQRLSAALVEMGLKAAVLGISAAEQTADWFNNFEASHDVIFYCGDTPDSPWTQQCLRQADRVFLLARTDRPLPLRPLEMPAFKARATGLPELLLLHPDGKSRGLPEHFALKSGLFESHHHIRAGVNEDVRRLARFVSGRAVGLVLAGGGARGFAHIGILKALHEARVPIDQLGGTSMGALIAAGLAAEWSHRRTGRPHAHGLRRDQSAVGLHLPAHRARARAQGHAISCATITATRASRNCRSRSSACRPISRPGASMCTGQVRCGAPCAPAWRCPAFFRRSPITAIFSWMAA